MTSRCGTSGQTIIETSFQLQPGRYAKGSETYSDCESEGPEWDRESIPVPTGLCAVIAAYRELAGRSEARKRGAGTPFTSTGDAVLLVGAGMLSLEEITEMEIAMERKMTKTEYAIVVMIAGLLVWLVSALFEPLSEGDRAEMLIDGTSGLPQDR
jgi:hypothetical protein